MYPSVAAAGLRLNADKAIVDGEIVAVDEHGRPSFQALQRDLRSDREPITQVPAAAP